MGIETRTSVTNRSRSAASVGPAASIAPGSAKGRCVARNSRLWSSWVSWIRDDFLNNLCMNPPFGYYVDLPERTWFDRGGASIQPNLLAGLLPHLERDEIPVYLWMFCSCWNACYREEITAMVEHPYPVLGFSNNAHFKTSDEANAGCHLLRQRSPETATFLHPCPPRPPDGDLPTVLLPVPARRMGIRCRPQIAVTATMPSLRALSQVRAPEGADRGPEARRS
jgi:hypothetical protein